jgi:bacterioferritin (cytochrome b1)
MTRWNSQNFEMSDRGQAVRQLNSLLRGELSAVETYQMTINRVAGQQAVYADSVEMLRRIEADHHQAADVLRQRVQSLGGRPTEGAGAWGAWAKFIQGTVNLLGDPTTALKGLKEGEEHGLRDYQESLDEVDEQSRQVIQQRLIPAEQQHIATIDRLMMANSQG